MGSAAKAIYYSTIHLYRRYLSNVLQYDVSRTYYDHHHTHFFYFVHELLLKCERATFRVLEKITRVFSMFNCENAEHVRIHIIPKEKYICFVKHLIRLFFEPPTFEGGIHDSVLCISIHCCCILTFCQKRSAPLNY